MEFDSVWEAFYGHLVGLSYAENTVAAYRVDLLQFFAFLQERSLSVERVRSADVSEYLAFLASRGVAASSRGRKVNTLKSFFRFLVSVNRVSENPVATIKTPKVDVKEMRVLSEVEYRRLRDVVRANSLRDYAVVELVLQTGLRVSEVCNLQYPRDVEFSSKSVHARMNQLVDSSITVRQSKSRKERIIPLNSVAQRAIKAYLKGRPVGCSTEHLFVTNRTTPMTRPLLHRLLKRYFVSAGISGASFHTLRHTFATHSLNKGTNLLVVQETLGHKHLTTTQKYLHFIREKQVEQLEQNAL